MHAKSLDRNCTFVFDTFVKLPGKASKEGVSITG
jgi:hypothetical protein